MQRVGTVPGALGALCNVGHPIVTKAMGAGTHSLRLGPSVRGILRCLKGALPSEVSLQRQYRTGEDHAEHGWALSPDPVSEASGSSRIQPESTAASLAE